MVSVIIPCHNNKKTIDAAVRSVLSQTVKDIELIIVDNGSEAESEDGAGNYSSELYTDPRIRLFVTDKAMGAATARNKGIELSRGQYIAFLDADDMWREDKLDKQIKVMERYTYNGEYPIICFTGREMIDEEGNSLDRYIGCEKTVNYDKLLLSNQINCSSVLVRKEDIEKYMFTDGDFHEDYALWLEMLKEGGYAAGINRPLISYRVSSGSKSGNKIKSAMMTYKVYRFIGLGIPKSMVHMISYTVKGIKKHFA